MRIPGAARTTATSALLALFTTFAPLSAVSQVAHADFGPWANFHGNAQHTGSSAAAGPRGLALAWYSLFPDDVDASPAIGADGTVYGVSTDGTLQAFSPDGGIKWTAGVGSRTFDSPALGPDGLLFIGDSAGRFRAVRVGDGTFAWTRTGYGSVRGNVVAQDGTVYFGTDRGELVGMDKDGKERFRLPGASGVTSAPAIGPNGDLYWATQGQQIRHAASTGDPIWDVALSDGVVASSPAIGSDGTVYVGAGASLLALDGGSGAVKWRIGVGAALLSTPAIGADGTIYAGAENGLLTAATSSGTVRWQYQAGGAVRSSPAVGPDGLVYFGSGDANFYVVDASGKKVSNYRGLDAFHGAAAIAPSGLVVAGARDNRLYAFKDSARRLAESPADRLGGDLARDPGTGKVYVIVDGQRRYIPDPTTQLILGLAGPMPINLAPNELARYPEGPALPAIGEGTLLQETNGPVYVIRGGQRVWIRSVDEFNAGGYSWDALLQVEDRIARSISLAPADQILVKGAGDRVYLLVSGQRRWISTADAFTSRGYTWPQVHFVSDATLAIYPEGEAIS